MKLRRALGLHSADQAGLVAGGNVGALERKCKVPYELGPGVPEREGQPRYLGHEAEGQDVKERAVQRRTLRERVVENCCVRSVDRNAVHSRH